MKKETHEILEFFEVLPWNQNFETGIPEIDEQHRQLVDLLNQLAAHVANKSSIDTLNQALGDLTDYTHYHFSTEEKIWHTYFEEDPWLNNHVHAHSGFISKITDLKKEQSTRSSDELVEDIVKFLIHWLASHILDTDRRMAIAVLEFQKGLSIDQAKEIADEKMNGAMRVLIDTVLSMYEILTERTMELMREKVERKRTKEALSVSEKHEKSFSDSILNSMPGMLLLCDDKNRLVRWNQKCLDLTGYSPEEIAGKNILDFFEENNHLRIQNMIDKIFSEGFVEIEEDIRTKTNLTIPISFTAVPLTINATSYFTGIGLDITKLRNAENKVVAYVKLLENMMQGTLQAVSNMVEQRDPYTAGHERRVGIIAADIAREMGWSSEKCQNLQLVGLVHDIGKIGIPAEILSKPGRLTTIEYEMVKTHVERGYEILKDVEFPLPIAEIIHEHHERMDGSGYPRGLKDQEILVEARIIAVADVLESMSSHRPYRPALGIETALKEIVDHRGTLFDSLVVDAVLRLIHEKSYQLPA